MQPTITTTLFGGFIGTLMMSLMMKFAAPMITGHPMDIAALLGNMLGGMYFLGMTLHIILGVVIFPLVYSILLYQFLPGAAVVKGMLYGTILWLLAATVVMPLAGAGFFMSAIGGVKAAMAALLGYWVYGGLLGVIARVPACPHCRTNHHLA